MRYLRLKWQELREEREVVRSFYHHGFSAIDRALKRAYLWDNPYRMCKRFLLKRGMHDPHQYGETPLTTLYDIGKSLGIESRDHLFELGAGRGRSAFFLHKIFGCKVTAIEWIPQFIGRAERIARHFDVDIAFLCEDYTKSDLSKATIIYLYGTCLPDETIRELCKHIPIGVRVISVSYPLSDYDSRFRLVKKYTACYPWGETEVYLNV